MDFFLGEFFSCKKILNIEICNMSVKHGVMMPEQKGKSLLGVSRWIFDFRRNVLRLFLQYVNPRLGKVAEVVSEPKDFIRTILPENIGKWLVISAIITALLVLIMPENFWSWQLVIFMAIFLLGPVLERLLKGIKSGFYNLLVTYPGKYLLDQEIKLDQPIVEGSSEVTLHGENWVLMGEDSPVGNSVRVVAIKENILYVVPVK